MGLSIRAASVTLINGGRHYEAIARNTSIYPRDSHFSSGGKDLAWMRGYVGSRPRLTCPSADFVLIPVFLGTRSR